MNQRVGPIVPEERSSNKKNYSYNQLLQGHGGGPALFVCFFVQVYKLWEEKCVCTEIPISV